MKPSHIFKVLDAALEAREKNEIFTPLFTGEAGLGKSQIVQQWVKSQQKDKPNFGFLDLRIAYYEAPDLIGFPETIKDNENIRRTTHCLPDFWPTSGEGLILLEEPNRGTSGVMNCLMQLLTDRKVNQYSLPPGWVIAGCINPESSNYDVNAMDTALKDRFEEFEVEYDALTFIDFIEDNKWHNNIQMFVKSGIWIYKTSKELSKEAKYISPRTWAKVNAMEKTGLSKDRQMHRIAVTSILGRDIGNEYHQFCFDQAPVTAADLLKDKDAALNKLRQQADPSNSYQGGMIGATVESIEKNYGGVASLCKDTQINEDLMVEVAKIIPSDHAVNLLRSCAIKQSKGNISSFFAEFSKRHPELMEILKAHLRLEKAVSKK